MVWQDEKVVTIKGEHCHTSEFREVVEVKDRMIIQENITKDNRDIISVKDKSLRKKSLGAFLSKSKDIRRRADRFKSSFTPGAIIDVKQLSQISEEYSLIEGSKFFRLNIETSAGRILIFASDDGLKIQEGCKEWHGYGTFATSTQLFYQVYPIFGSVDGRPTCLIGNPSETHWRPIGNQLQTHWRPIGDPPENF